MILTIVGYSVNDTVVIYDRVRENQAKFKGRPLGEIVNLSINETLGRTFLTSFATALSLIGPAHVRRRHALRLRRRHARRHHLGHVLDVVRRRADDDLVRGPRREEEGARGRGRGSPRACGASRAEVQAGARSSDVIEAPSPKRRRGFLYAPPSLRRAGGF